MTRIALITGAGGQDGWYLGHALLATGYKVYGLVRSADRMTLSPNMRLVVGDVCDEESLRSAIAVTGADVVFNLAAVSSVAASWSDPVVSGDVNGLGVARLLHAVAAVSIADGREIRVVQASSAEIFGSQTSPSDEATRIEPTNPYGIAKAYAHHLVAAYRENGVHASNAILFSHESPRRPHQFVTRKITSTVARIAAGHQDRLELGNVDVIRDWGFAGDYMAALILMSEQEQPGDFVLATGVGHSVREFVEMAFLRAGVADWQRFVQTSDGFRRPSDVAVQIGLPNRARSILGWVAETSFADIVGSMVKTDLSLTMPELQLRGE